MCFYYDADWHASVVVTEDGPAKEHVRCGECGKRINAGEWTHYVYLQEHDEGECDEDDGEFHAGETFEMCRCRECHDIIRLIEAVEIARGCRVSESRPALGDLYEALDYDPDYIEEIHQQRPDLATHLSTRFPDLGRTSDLRLVFQKLPADVLGKYYCEIGGEG